MILDKIILLLFVCERMIPESGRLSGCGRWYRKPPPQIPQVPKSHDSSAQEPRIH